MKKTIILSLALLMGFMAQSQDTVYESIVGTSATTWSVAQFLNQLDFYADSDDSTIVDVCAGTTRLKINRDDTLLIDSNIYYCLHPSECTGFWFDYDGLLFSSYGDRECPLLIRESEDNSKLYFRPRGIDYGRFQYETEEEVLIMDLDLNVGDTLNHIGLDHFTQFVRDCYPSPYFRNSKYPNLYIIADSVYYKDGRKHIRTNLITDIYRQPQDTLTFIEGIGPTQGFFYWTILFRENFYERMHCCEKDDNQIYWRYGSCNYYIRISIESLDTDNNIYLVYPNPAHEVIEICGMDNSLHTITIVSLAGQEVYRTSSYNNNVSVNVGSFAAGFYLVCVDGRTIGRMVKR